jgi:glycosyltransferase involved in cell wall biosynthesis
MTPFFSVVIPAYNRASFLTRTITSVLQQSYPDFELLVIDDGSTDNTRELMRSFTEKDARVRYIHQENAERGAARNNGIRMAKGEWIVFLDSDDELYTEHLSTLKKHISIHPDIQLIASRYEISENGKIIPQEMGGLSPGKITFSSLLKGNPFACNISVKKSNPSLILFREERVFSSMEDWIFILSNTWSKDLLFIPETTVLMHEHPNRSMRFHDQVIKSRMAAQEFILAHFSLKKKEIKILKGFTYYFCSVHAFLSGKRKMAISFWMKTLVQPIPFKRKCIHGMKLILGKNISDRLVNLIRKEK